jgi:hypothetical protein
MTPLLALQPWANIKLTTSAAEYLDEPDPGLDAGNRRFREA